MSPVSYKLVINAALGEIGAPYVWGGKGEMVFDPQKGLVPHGFVQGDQLMHVFDCSGLVNWSIKKAGGPDWRATHSAQTLYDLCRNNVDPFDRPGSLVFCGRDFSRVTHVQLSLGGGLVVEAAGGDHFVTTPLHALERGASVRAHFNRRRDIILIARLPDTVVLYPKSTLPKET